MGQQQLLLLVLSTVIVGLATVAGIQAFSENQQQAAVDALNQQVLEYATEAQAAASKPTEMGGISSLSDATFSNLNLASGTGTTTINTAQGKFEITTGASPSNVSKDNLSTTCSGSINVYAEDPTTGAQVCAEVSGKDGIEAHYTTKMNGADQRR